MVRAYNEVLTEWLNDEIIEEVLFDEWDVGHYLLHRPVLKENSTTAIRPVFDASSHKKREPSLNQCLVTGPNLIELIPSILFRFRQHKIGVIADTKRAFLQISVHNADRDSLRFLWISNDQLKIFRHARVRFGVSSSPFLLGAVLDHHIKRCLTGKQEDFDENVLHKLHSSWYVDNVVTSIPSEEDLVKFIDESTRILDRACLLLRGWEYFDLGLGEPTETAVLGIKWDKKNDRLSINVPQFDLQEFAVLVTRRKILSAYQKIFDPIGMTAPALLVPKILIQKTWISNKGWDEELDCEVAHELIQWIKEAVDLKALTIPRFVFESCSRVALHTFCDASQEAFATVCFLRVEGEDGEVSIHLLGAKSRVAPLKKVTIPRLELLAACIGARLTSNILKEFPGIDVYYWYDSTTVLAWIKRDQTWGVFVMNRVNEIRSLTNKDLWHHVPGLDYPADLLSRGCSPRFLLQSRWWEGPSWLKRAPNDWPNSSSTDDELEIMAESRKTAATIININKETDGRYLSQIIFKLSNYSRLIRTIAWMYHWRNDSRKPGIPDSSDIGKAEEFILKFVQQESFCGPDDQKLKRLKPICDTNGILRVKTKITNRDDDDFFKMPIILPSDHPVVTRLVEYTHRKNHHIGGQTLRTILREKYWILRSQAVVRHVIRECVSCRRYEAKHLDVESPALPVERVRDANVFEISRTDFAGPLYCEGGKVWVVIFTCAVFRAVHLDVVSSLSTDGFLMAFRRFVNRRGRPHIMFSDNGTNYQGMSNLLGTVDWSEIANCTAVDKIEWKFSPPPAPWWGGFWERIVGLLKYLLRKTLGNSTLTKEELYTVLTDCEALINSRPITYLSDVSDELIPISPIMFLQEMQDNGLPDCDTVEANSLTKRVKYRQRVCDDLKRRFRSEYLGQLLSSKKDSSATRSPALGEVVLIGSDDKKRMDWPLGVVKKLMTGKDGKCRVVLLKTAHGDLIRHIKRVYPLETLRLEEEDDILRSAQAQDGAPLAVVASRTDEARTPVPWQTTIDSPSTSSTQQKRNQEVYTRCGRKVKIPAKYDM